MSPPATTPADDWCARSRQLLGLPALRKAAATTAQAAEPADLGRAVSRWNQAVEAAGKQISRLDAALRQTKDERCIRIAEYGLNGLTKNRTVALRAALLECQSGATVSPAAKQKALAAIAAYRQFLETDKLLPMLARNPFGIECDVRNRLAGRLQDLEAGVSS
ncbi:MAG: hypothetical protein KDC98_18220 [Planctomycetes bacterium]|nr:hypothetical protein [Planctomycetota bacterium]